MQSIDLGEVQIGLNVNNELREPVSIKVGSAFVNGQLIPFAQIVEIPRRERTEIVLSNVATAYLFDNGA